MTLAPSKHEVKTLSIDGEQLSMVLNDGTEEHFDMGFGKWRYSTLNGLPRYSISAINRMQGFAHGFTAAAAYAWTSPTTLEVKIHYVDWISGTAITFDFGKQEVTMVDTYPNSKAETIAFTMK